MKYINKISDNPSISAIKQNKLVMFLIKLAVLIVVISLFFFGLKKLILHYLNLKNDSPYLIKGNKNAKNSLVIDQDPNNENSITLYRSDNQDTGIQFTYSFWLVIENMQYNYGKLKHIFHKGNKTGFPNKAPGVFIHPEKNALRIYMNTYKDINEFVDIENIPLKKWVHVSIVLDHSYLDIYINGRIRKRHQLSSLPKQNFGNVWVNIYGGFDGFISNLRYYRRALEYYEIEKIVKKGPSNSACSSGEMPPYLNDNWWFDI